MNLIDSLMKTGLTRHESELYVALGREGELTGYEAAKLSGIPRANAYQALAGLVDKGGAYIVEGAVLHYIAVPIEEYCSNLLIHMKELTDVLRREFPVLRSPAEPYITITGFGHIQDKMRHIIGSAKERVYVSLSEKELPLIQKELEKAADDGLKVVAILSGTAELKGAVLHRIEKAPGQIRLIADSSQVLTGSVLGKDDDTCLFSKNRPLVELIKDSLKNEIRLARLEKGEKSNGD